MSNMAKMGVNKKSYVPNSPMHRVFFNRLTIVFNQFTARRDCNKTDVFKQKWYLITEIDFLYILIDDIYKKNIQFFHHSLSRTIWVWVFRSHSQHGSSSSLYFYLATWSWILGPLLSFMSGPIQIWKLTHMLIQVNFKLNFNISIPCYSQNSYLEACSLLGNSN